MASQSKFVERQPVEIGRSDLPLATNELALNREIAFLHYIKTFNNNAICEVEQFLHNANLFNLAREYNTNLAKRDVDIGFNLFAIVSDIYYRENFHSDILKTYLSNPSDLTPPPVFSGPSGTYLLGDASPHRRHRHGYIS
jgi:hypothetical protein